MINPYLKKQQLERNKDIFELYRTGRYTLRKLGDMYGLSRQTIWGIVKVEEAKEQNKQGDLTS